MPIPTTIIVNPNCHNGKGYARWKNIEQDILLLLPQARVKFLESGVCMAELLPALDEPQCFVAAGGDGSVHQLLNHILTEKSNQRQRIILGAIGLGSSNDYHKPFTRTVRGIPVRINMGQIFQHDVGVVYYADEHGQWQKKYFLVNASMGATAFGNYLFNHPDAFLSYLKRNHVRLANLWAATKAIVQFRNTRARLEWENHSLQADVTNMNLLKLPYVSGQFHYRDPILPDDGKLYLNLCHSMRLWERIQALYALSKGALQCGPHMISTPVKTLRVNADKPILFECDGETFFANQVRVEVMPGHILTAK